MIDQLMAPDVKLTDLDKEQIARKVAKLDKLLTHWDEDTVWIRVALKPHQARSTHVHALITVGIPRATLVTEADGETPTQAVGYAVDEMERELRKRKTRYEQKRKAPRTGEVLMAEAEAAAESEIKSAPPAEPR